MDAASRYQRIRREHLALALRDLSRRQQGAILAIAAFLGPFLVAFAHPAAQQMAAAVLPGATPGQRLAVFAAWLLLSSLLVLALCEAVFMLRARTFLASLPLSPRDHFIADARAIAAAYSLLWVLPAYAAYLVMAARASLAMRLSAVGALATVIAAVVAAQAQAPRWLARARREASRPSHWTTRSGLALRILAADVPQATALRLVAASLAVAGSILMSTVEGQCVRAWGFVVVEAVFVAWALQRLPGVVDERLRRRLASGVRGAGRVADRRRHARARRGARRRGARGPAVRTIVERAERGDPRRRRPRRGQLAVSAPRVELRGVSFGYGSKAVLRDFTAEFGSGVHLLVGANGSGKTTLLNLVAGVLRADRGEVLVCAEPAEAARARSFLVPDESPAMPWLRADEFLAFAASLYPKRGDAPAHEEIVRRLGLDPFLAKRFAELSSGTSRKLVLAAALAAAPDVFLLDEPTNELDAASVAAFVTLLAGLPDRVALVATHQPEHFTAIARSRRDLATAS